MVAGFKKPPFAKSVEETVKVDEVETEETTEEEKPMKEETKRNTKTLDAESIRFIRQNVREMTYAEMAEKLGLSKHQVNRALQYLKEQMRKHALDTDDAAYGKKQNSKGEDVPDWSNPLSEIAKKVETKIENEMSRPAQSRPGGGGGGKVKKALDAELDDLLADL